MYPKVINYFVKSMSPYCPHSPLKADNYLTPDTGKTQWNSASANLKINGLVGIGNEPNSLYKMYVDSGISKFKNVEGEVIKFIAPSDTTCTGKSGGSVFYSSNQLFYCNGGGTRFSLTAAIA